MQAFGITGLRRNFGQVSGIEEPYWGPSINSLWKKIQKQKQQTLVSNPTMDHYPITGVWKLEVSAFLKGY